MASSWIPLGRRLAPTAAGTHSCCGPRTLQVRTALTMVEKILRKHLVGDHEVSSGAYISFKPLQVMTHDNTYHVIKKFKGLGATSVADPTQMVFVIDHDVQNVTDANLARYDTIRRFAEEQGVDYYAPGRGIGHQVMCEEGYAVPGTMCVASDSHSNMYGGIGCLGTPVVRTDAASIWATGRTWWRVPPIARVELTGSLPSMCSGKDVIIALCGKYNNDDALNHALEFVGEGVASLSIEDRMTIANMSTEWGALCGLFPADDDVALAWAESRTHKIMKERPGASPFVSAQHRADRMSAAIDELRSGPALRADPDATYAKHFTLDLSRLMPLVIGPNDLKRTRRPHEERRKIHKAWLLSCVNSRASDIAAAAEVAQGKKFADWVEFYLAPASSEVKAEAVQRGHWQVLLAAGAIELPPGCGACAGLGRGTARAGEVGIAATNRNFKGRMGHRDSEVYLASPKIVAQSAIDGYISEGVVQGEGSSMLFNGNSDVVVGSRLAGKTPAKSSSSTPLVSGFPHEITGELVYVHGDNISTDGIYHGRHMYEDLSREQMAAVAMENHDPAFVEKLSKLRAPILACGQNFGTGSSREQAAQCFRYLGVSAIIAKSYSATYVRNALNNGLPIFEAPEFIDYIAERHGALTNAASPTLVTNISCSLDLEQWLVKAGNGQTFPVRPIGPAAQELLAAGGLEPWIKAQLKMKRHQQLQELNAHANM